MNHPRRREVERFIHVDSRDFNGSEISSYNICFGPLPKDNDGKLIDVPAGSAYLPVQDYNNVIKLELKAFMSNKPPSEDYVIFKIKNVDGKVDTTTGIGDACTVCYFDPNGKKPIYFGGTEFEFNPPISKLSNLKIDIVDHENNYCDIREPGNGNDGNKIGSQSFLLKITYIEGNLY